MTEYFIDPIGDGLERVVETGPSLVSNAEPEPAVRTDPRDQFIADLHAAALDARMAVERIVQWSRTVKDPLLHTTSNKLAIEALGAVDGLLDMMEAS